MTHIVGEVATDGRELDRLNRSAQNVYLSVKQEVSRLAVELQNKVKSEKLNGSVLHRRTGTLMRSIDQRVTEESSGIFGYVGTNLRYGIAHEFGVNESVTVRAHTRIITQAFGRTIDPTTVNVRSFSRNMHLPERSFLRTSLREFSDTVRDRIIASVRAGFR